MSDEYIKGALILGVCAGLAGAIAAASFVVATGLTAGQRCSDAGFTGSSWKTCVEELTERPTE